MGQEYTEQYTKYKTLYTVAFKNQKHKNAYKNSVELDLQSASTAELGLKV